MKTHSRRLAGILVLALTLTRLHAAGDPSPYEAEILKSAVLYQPLVWVGNLPPSNEESQILAADISDIKAHGLANGITALESFVATHTNSPWAPSVLANLGRYEFEHGRYSEAIQNWKNAWMATKDATDGPAKQVADFTFAYLTKLLVGVGQVNEVRPLLEETQKRTFDALPLRQIINSTRQEYKLMVGGTDVSFRCGAFALNDMLRSMKHPALDMAQVMISPSPVTGFSLNKLVEMGKQAGAELVAAQWGGNKLPVVPAVVHWKQNHYAAIIGQKNGLYQVTDLALGRTIWLSATDIQAEASGNFIVPKAQLPSDWRLLTAVEAEEIYGRGYVSSAPDGPDCCGNGSGGGGSAGGNGGAGSGAGGGENRGGGAAPPGRAPCLGCGLGGSGGGGSTGGSGSGCCGGSDEGGSNNNNGNNNSPVAPGMPIWEVSEPAINVWLYDEPMGYQPGLGGKISFRLAYKQRDDETYGVPRTISPNIFSMGYHWNCSWISYVMDDGYGSTATMFVAGGGVRTYTLDNSTKEYYSHTVMERTTDSNGNLTGFILSYANGAKDYYQFVPSEKLDVDKKIAFLTAKVDQYGHSTEFVYQDTNSVATLQYVIDADNRTNTLYYANASYPALVTSVADPFGHSTQLQYDSTGILTNITDVVGITSSFQYNEIGWVTNLVTPYGTTRFIHANLGDDWTDPVFGDFTMVRGVTVVDAAGGTNIYMLRQDSSFVYTNGNDGVPFLLGYPGNYSTNGVQDDADVPDNLPAGIVVDNIYIYYRDTFHWGPRQSVGLPADLTTFAPSDFIKARMSHWLHDARTGGLGQTLDMQQAPSQDGVACGQTTWYVYDGSSFYEGYDSQPSIIAQVVPDGTTKYVWYQRDEWGRATNIVDTFSSSFGATPDTRTNVYVYDANGINLIQHVGALGESEGYAYDGNNQLLFYTNALNEVTSYAYDSQGRRTSTTTPAGLTTANIYYSSGAGLNFLQATIDLQINRTNSYTYANDLVYTHTDERGLTTTNTWDALNRLRRVDYPDGTFITNSYYRLDLVKTVDRVGYPTWYGYDSVRRMIAVTNALGNCTLYNYCPCGALESIQDAAGNFTYCSYDNAGNKLSATYPDNYVVNYAYDLLGHVINTTDSGGVSTTNWYDNQGLRYAVSNAVGRVSWLAFDPENRITNAVDVNNVSIGMTYDSLGRIRTRTYPDSGVEAFGYTFGVSSATSYTNQISKVTFYGYDVARRKIAETNALTYVTSFTYDPAGDLLTLTDGNHDTTTWGYDSYGRVTNKVDAANNLLFLYKYDPDNRLTNRWSAAKGSTAYAYDAVGNLMQVSYPVSPAITLKYDTLNRLTNMVDAVGTTVYGYDAVGQLLSEDGPWASDTMNYTYQNRLRQTISVQTPNGSAWTQDYGYDLARRLKSITSPAGVFDYIYDPVGSQRVDELSLPNGAYVTNSFDNMARLRGTWLMSSKGTNLDSYVYGYNQANQRTNVVRAAGDYVNYTYDNIGELYLSFGCDAGGTARQMDRILYRYDGVGNMLQKESPITVYGTTHYSVNILNQITNSTYGGTMLGPWTSTITVSGSSTSPANSVTVNGQNATLHADNTFEAPGQTVNNGVNTFTAVATDVYGRTSTSSSSVNVMTNNSVYSYDLNGNLLADGTRNFAYDDENQLISVWKTNAWRNDFVYDGKMRRRIEKDYTWNGSAWTQTNEIHFVYDGNLVVQERDGNNQPQVTYTRGNDLSGTLQGAGGIGGLLARTDRAQVVPWIVTAGGSLPQFGTHSYYHADGNGNVTALISASQMIIAKYLYDPYGNMLSMYGLMADVNSYRFSSKEWSRNSGLYYYLYRFYDPNLQRWPNRDPLGDNGFLVHKSLQTSWSAFKSIAERKQGPSLYWFVRNDPVILRDSFGLDCDSELCACLDKNKKDYKEQMCEFGKAYNSMKNRLDETEKIMDQACDSAFPDPNSFGNINCKNMAADSLAPSHGALWAGYNAEVALATTALGLANASCYVAYFGCLTPHLPPN